MSGTTKFCETGPICDLSVLVLTVPIQHRLLVSLIFLALGVRRSRRLHSGSFSSLETVAQHDIRGRQYAKCQTLCDSRKYTHITQQPSSRAVHRSVRTALAIRLLSLTAHHTRSMTMATSSTAFYETPMASEPQLPPSPHASRTNLNGGSHADTDDSFSNDQRPPQTVLEPAAVHRHGFLPFITKPLGNFNPSLVLENSGSVARDHLASERTFLAYVRTSLTIASAGIALFQLFALSGTTTNSAINKYSRPVGATIVALGIAVLFIGITRYFTVQVALVKGVYPVARITPAFLSVSLLAIVFVVFGILLGIRNGGS